MSSSSAATAGGLPGKDSPSSSPRSFEHYLLSVVARNPGLLSESPLILRDVSPASFTTLDDGQCSVLRQHYQGSSATPASTGAVNQTTSKAKGKKKEGEEDAAASVATNALLQRAIVDTPLLPLAGEHILYETLLAAFAAAASAAQRVRDVKAQKPTEHLVSSSTDTVSQPAGVAAPEGSVTKLSVATSEEGDTDANAAWKLRVREAEVALAAAKKDLERAFHKARWIVSALSAFVAKTPSELREGVVEESGTASGHKRPREA